MPEDYCLRCFNVDILGECAHLQQLKKVVLDLNALGRINQRLQMPD
jgi:hypothetical protein